MTWLLAAQWGDRVSAHSFNNTWARGAEMAFRRWHFQRAILSVVKSKLSEPRHAVICVMADADLLSRAHVHTHVLWGLSNANVALKDNSNFLVSKQSWTLLSTLAFPSPIHKNTECHLIVGNLMKLCWQIAILLQFPGFWVLYWCT